MKKISLTIDYSIYDNPDELPEKDKKLLNEAILASKEAYAPYSNFKVGAAVLLKNGQIVSGSNQENAAYPSGLCAERVALFYASSKYPDISVEAIAVTAFSEDFSINDPVTPCGSCRQVMAETEQRFANDIKVIMYGESGKVYVTQKVNNLLPLMFHAEELKK
ncbi:MAG: cytidine deaminase [Bacteroidales bacterium]|nr:cytidine deaminase [Bacteroidales bacterium]MCF8405299.1 cytidine deaminase [Bacteroidales bacterium]